MRIRLFFSALALTLLLLLPMIGLVEYFDMQRQMQERVRRANAAGTAVQVDPASRYMGSLLLAVQKEEPEFILLRMDAPAATLTLCGLPGNMQLAAPSGTTTLAAAYLAAGPARAAQLLGAPAPPPRWPWPLRSAPEWTPRSSGSTMCFVMGKRSAAFSLRPPWI